MLALLVFPQRFLYSMGIAGVLVALAAGTAALIVLPAVLALLASGSTLSPRPASGTPPSPRPALRRPAAGTGSREL